MQRLYDPSPASIQETSAPSSVEPVAFNFQHFGCTPPPEALFVGTTSYIDTEY